MKNFLKKAVAVVLVIVFVLCFGIVVYYLGNSLVKSTNINVNLKAIDGKDSISAVMTTTDNAINKIYNILVVSTIFFTVLVTTISIFQYLKTRDIEEYKKEFKSDLDNVLKSFNEKIDPAREKMINVEKQLNQKTLEYDIKIKEIDNLKNELVIQKSVLERKAAELEVEVCFLKAKEAHEKKYYDNASIRINEYSRIINISKCFENIVSIDRLAVIYNNLASAYEDIGSLNKAEKYYKTSFEIKQVDKEQSIVCSNLARLSYKQGQLSKVLSYCDEAYKFDEKNVFLYIWRAVVIAQKSDDNDLNDALNNFKIAYSISSRVTIAEMNFIINSHFIDNLINNSKFKAEIDNMIRNKM